MNDLLLLRRSPTSNALFSIRPITRADDKVIAGWLAAMPGSTDKNSILTQLRSSRENTDSSQLFHTLIGTLHEKPLFFASVQKDVHGADDLLCQGLYNDYKLYVLLALGVRISQLATRAWQAATSYLFAQPDVHRVLAEILDMDIEENDAVTRLGFRQAMTISSFAGKINCYCCSKDNFTPVI
jgi:hypothetical protein